MFLLSKEFDYTAYPLAKQQFELEESKDFYLIQVIGLTNDDAYPLNIARLNKWLNTLIEHLNLLTV